MNDLVPHHVEGVIYDGAEPQPPAEHPPVNWLKQAISKGLSMLVVLHLDGGPAAETVTHTASAWYRVIRGWPITWNEALDRPRLTAAFIALASQSIRWPSPSQLRALLPARIYPQPALPPPDYPEEKAKANLKKIKEMMQAAIKKIN